MRSATDATEVDQQPRQSAKPAAALYFIVFIIVGSMFVLNLYIGVIIDHFNRIAYDSTGLTFVTAEQRQLLLIKRVLEATNPARTPKLPPK